MKKLKTKSDIIDRLLTIGNIANMAVLYPQEKAEVYVLQDVFKVVSEMIQDLIEDVELEQI